MPWHLPEDLQHFRNTTMGMPVVMGRKTWESLPHNLLGRVTVVVSASLKEQKLLRVNTLDEALEFCAKHYELAWVIGGAQLFEAAIPRADKMCVTHIDAEYEGDTYMPYIDYKEWRETSGVSAKSATGVAYTIKNYERRNHAENAG